MVNFNLPRRVVILCLAAAALSATVYARLALLPDPVTVRLDVYGTIRTVTTEGESLAQLFRRLDIVPEERDFLSHDIRSVPDDGTTVILSRSRVALEQREVPIPAEAVTEYTDQLPVGETETTPGTEGVCRYLEEVGYRNDQEMFRQVVSKQIIRQPTPTVTRIGTGEAAPVLSPVRTLVCSATAYSCEGIGYTASGTVARVGAVSVDPSVIPLGSRLYIVSNDGLYDYGYCVAEDTGGAIIGNTVDLYFDTLEECYAFGRREVTVYILE